MATVSYGVRFLSDGSVAHPWNGRTQERRARERLTELRATYPRDHFALVVRDALGQPWREVDERDVATTKAATLAWVRDWAMDPRHEHTLMSTPIDELDNGITRTVLILAANGVETFESCQGGEGHCFFEPTVRFYGNKGAGFHALSVAHNFDLRPTNLRRYWYMLDQEPVGPSWELTFA